jgi:hypothetical protein
MLKTPLVVKRGGECCRYSKQIGACSVNDIGHYMQTGRNIFIVVSKLNRVHQNERQLLEVSKTISLHSPTPAIGRYA